MTEWNDNREQENMEAGPDGREEEQTPELEEQEDGRTERESLRYVYPGKKEPVGRFGSRRWGTRLKMAVLLLLVAVAGFVVGHVILLFASGNGVNNFKVMTKLTMLEAYVDHFFLDETDGSRLEDYIYKGYIAGLDDPYAAYYNEEEYAQLMEEDSGEYVGIGVTVRQDPDTGYVLVEQVNKGGPAYNAGVQADDIIMAVDGEDTAELGLQDTVALIKKNEKPVVLTILRGSESMELTVDKSQIVMETVTWEMKENHTGYIAVSQFIDNTSEQFNEALTSLTEEGMTSLIIDLRDNGGGLLTACLDMVSRFVPDEKLIVYTEDKKGNRTEYNSDSVDVIDLPVVLLVNENSASASEIMTGCLKDYGIATIVGETTYGKGIVQNIMPLPDGSAVKMTVSKYYTPNGSNIHEVGITPDVTVEMSDEEWAAAQDDPAKDTQLHEAYQILAGQKQQ
ncbi:MAG TPA: S41 family peptidase [Candidatus Anaerobutyricum avicola]|nr:S41 family peptidase [Candidatus Anaerobutyricum avicola]